MEKVKMRTFLILSIFLLFVTSCQERGYGTQNIETIPGVLSSEPLTIKSTTPSQGSAIAQRAYISVVFSTTLDPSTVTTRSIHLKSNNQTIKIELTVVNNLLYIRPDNTLKDQATYTLTIDQSITDFFGNTLKGSASTNYHCEKDFWKSVEAGKTHAMAQSKEGDIYMWGSNIKNSLLVDPILYSVDMPFPITEQKNSKNYNAGGHTSAIVTSESDLVTAGAFRPAGTLSAIKTVSLGETHGVLVYDNRTLYSWGSNDRGELGNFGISAGSTLVLEYSESEDWDSVSAGSNFSLAIKENDTLWGWGANDEGQLGIEVLNERRRPTQEDTNSKNWIAVSSGTKHALGLQKDGSLWSWGNNDSGTLGHGDNNNRRKAEKISGTSIWTLISAGANHSLAIDNNGTLWAWGSNQHGQLGLNNTINQNIPVQVDSNLSWVSVSAGDRFSIGVKSDGTLWSWGYNFYDQLGLGQTDDLLVPTEIK